MRKLTATLLLAVFAAFGQSAPAVAKKPVVETKTSTLPRVENLKFAPLKQVKIPEITTFTLPNGMRVYMLENHELPLVSGTATVRTGNLFDPASKVGLAGLTGTVIRTGGTKTHTGDQLDEMLENIAASVESGIGETSGSVSFNALKENTDEVLAIFRDVLTGPEFRQDKIDLAKTQLRSAISRRNDEASDIAEREFASIVYGRNTPYGWDMTYEHVDNIQRADLVQFYDRHFFPANVMLSIYGDFNTAEMRARLEKLFATWTVKRDPVPPFPAVQPQKDAPGVYQATKTDVTQTFFEAGHLGGVLKDPDYPALSVMSDILGGGFSSRLFTNVRTRQGLAYNVGGGWGAQYNHPGVFRISGSTKSASSVDALQAIKGEIDRIRTTEVTDQELATAKQSVLNSFVFNFDHPRKILNRYVIYEYYGYPKDFIFQYQKGVEAVSKADVLRVAKERLKPEGLAIVAVGNPKEFGKALTALGPVKELDINLPEPKRASAKSDAASLARGKALLQKAQEALGGADKLAGVKDYTQLADASLASGPAGGLKIKQTVQWIRPGIIRSTQELPFGKIIVFWNGTDGWFSSPQGVAAIPPPVAQQVKSELFRNFFAVFLSDRDPERTVNAIGPNSVEITGKAGDRVEVDFDSATGLPAKLRFSSQSMQGGSATMTMTYSDWFDAGSGVKMPRKALMEQNGQKFGEISVTDTKINTGLTTEEISKKP